MRVWVPGACGQLGRALVRCLHEQPGVTAVVGTSRGQVDFTDLAAVQRFFAAQRFTHVFNAAAYTAVDAAEEEPRKAAQINHLAVALLARLCRKNRSVLVHVSTDYVFDGLAQQPYDEGSAVAPVGVYGESKRAGELAIAAVYPGVFDDVRGDAGISTDERVPAVPVYVVRTSWVFSDAGPSFVQTMMRLMRRHIAPRVVADQRGRPTYATDLAKALLHLSGVSSTEPAASGLYHLANTGETTWWQLASAIYDRLKQNGELGADHPPPSSITTAEYPTAAPRPPYSVLSTAKAEAALGYRLRSWRLALAAAMTEDIDVGGERR